MLGKASRRNGREQARKQARASVKTGETDGCASSRDHTITCSAGEDEDREGELKVRLLIKRRVVLTEECSGTLRPMSMTLSRHDS